MLLGVQYVVQKEPKEVRKSKEVRPDVDGFVVNVKDALETVRQAEDWSVTTRDKRTSHTL